MRELRLRCVDMYDVNIADSALEDLSGIAVYVKDKLKEPLIAEKLVAALKRAIFSLDAFPYRCPIVRDDLLAAQGIRGMIVENYVVFYSIVETENEKVVNVSRVLYARRNWVELLQSDNPPD